MWYVPLMLQYGMDMEMWERKRHFREPNGRLSSRWKCFMLNKLPLAIVYLCKRIFHIYDCLHATSSPFFADLLLSSTVNDLNFLYNLRYLRKANVNDRRMIANLFLLFGQMEVWRKYKPSSRAVNINFIQYESVCAEYVQRLRRLLGCAWNMIFKYIIWFYWESAHNGNIIGNEKYCKKNIYVRCSM